MSAVLALGAVGPETGNLQRFLVEGNFVDDMGRGLTVDEHFGRKTLQAFARWQLANGLPPRGFFDRENRLLAISQGFIPFVQAKNCKILFPKTRKIDLITMHCMENDEKPDQAENVALWFANKIAKYPAPMASAHFCLDSDSIVQCVRVQDVAYHAPGANHNGIGIELFGRARQTAAEWRDAPSQACLKLAASLVAKLCDEYDLPSFKVSPDELRAGGARGICGHFDVSLAFPPKANAHWDPGTGFVWGEFLAMVSQIRLGVLPP